MSNQLRAQKIESFGQAYLQVMAALEGIPESAWKFKPSPREWSIHEVIIHLADIEANAYVRVLKALAEPGGTIMPLDQDIWANNLFYHNQDAYTALEVFKWLRKKTYGLLLLLPADKWANVMNHPEAGLVSIDSWLDNYEKHGRVHAEQIKRVYAQWQERNHVLSNA